MDGESALYFGVSREYMVGIFESWGENIKAGHVGLMPKLEDVHKEYVKKFGEEPLTGPWSACMGSSFKGRSLISHFFSLEISGQTQSCRRTVYACVPEMVVRESPLCATHASSSMPLLRRSKRNCFIL